MEKYHSQFGQDRFIDTNVFNNMTGGVFIELGADDGINASNTLFFEKERGWNGICIEPRKVAYDQLVKNRKCFTVNTAISSDDSKNKKFLELEGGLGQLSGFVDDLSEQHKERIEEYQKDYSLGGTVIDMPSTTINKLLTKYDFDHVDYMSLDTEGGELEILKSIDFKNFPFNCISVENKYEDKDIGKFLESKGYRKVTRLKIDDIYVLKGTRFDAYHEPLGTVLQRLYIKFKFYVKKYLLKRT